MDKLKSYFNPGSLSWWSGIVAIILGTVSAFGFDHPAIGEFGRVIAALTGGTDASPAGLILLGTGIIGIRAKLSRGL